MVGLNVVPCYILSAIDQKTEDPVAIRTLAPDLARDDGVVQDLRAQVKSAGAVAHKNALDQHGGAIRAEFAD